MKASIFAPLLLATGSLAAIGTEMRRQRSANRISTRAYGTRKSHTRFPTIGYVDQGDSQATTDSNWAGATLVSTGYTAISGTVTVPKVSVPAGGSASTAYYASAWVGLDGDTCTSAILQTGVDFGIQNGKPTFEAWYEWYPAVSVDFPAMKLAEGDQIKMSINALSKTSGSAILENLTTGQTVSHNFTGQAHALCEENAEWIVEDFESGGGLVPFADFGTVTFTGATATQNGAAVGPAGATVMDIAQNGKTLTSCSTSSDSVTCSYSG